MPELSKLQIRAKVLSVISEIKSLKDFNENILSSFYEELSEIEDKYTIFDIFIKEFIKLNEQEYTFSGVLLKELVPNDYINSKAMELIKSSALSDENKYKLVQLLRITGSSCDYNEIPLYFDNPEEVLDKETQRLLESAVFNPESMLDFLDFISAVGIKDRFILLQSLKTDYKGDVLANIVYPILYSNFEDDFILEAIDILSDSKSSLAIAPFKYLIKVSDNKDIINACKTGLKKLQIAGAKEELADKYFKDIIRNSHPAEFFTTIPDGNGNQALLISRCNENGKYLLSAVVINYNTGIVDCFGFYNIAQEEVIKVISKFYKSEGSYKVPAEYIKTKINEAINLTVENKRKFPYEFICWSPLLSDIEPLDFSPQQYASKNCKLQTTEKEDIINLLTLNYTLRWFITPEENKTVKNIVESIYKTTEFDITILNTNIKNQVNEVFSDTTLNIWKNKLYNLIYLLRNNNKLKEADLFYTMMNNEELFVLFKQILIQRSVFNYFVRLKENMKDSALSVNIFRKRNSNEAKFDIKKIDKIIETLKRSWLDG